MRATKLPTYAWTRYWHPADETPSLSDEGYLHDRNSSWRAQNKTLVTMDELGAERCLVLRGEPGMGKSTELELAFAGARAKAAVSGDAVLFVQLRDVESSGDLARKLTDRPEFQEWRNGQHNLTLLIDSLDEGLLNARTLASGLVEILAVIPIERLLFRLASRVVDWPELLTDALAERWGDGNVRYFQLAPLRESDVVAAAQSESVANIDGFLSEIALRKVGALATRPVTLRMLLRTFRQHGSFPKSRASLYDAGCQLLATEVSKSRKAARRVGDLSPRERVAIAGRIAFTLIFSNRNAVWTGPDYGDIPSSDVHLDDFTGWMETAGGVRVNVRQSEIHEVLDTALFSRRGEGRVGFAHQTYAEHLAAWYMAEHKMTWPQVASLLLHRDNREQRIVPQLHETAARLAERGRGILEVIAACDPEVLLSSDLTTSTAQHRKTLVDALIDQTRREGVSFVNRFSMPDLSVLSHPEVEHQLKPLIADPSENSEVRELAIDIAVACGGAGLAETISGIAIDGSQPFEVRSAAAYAIVRTGDAGSRVRLKQLALNPPPDDEYDQLKGWALTAAWPAHMTAEELFGTLTPPKRSDHLGPYEKFLHDLADDVGPEDLIAALQWAELHSLSSGYVAAALTGILGRAWDHLDAPGVLDHFARIACERLRHHELIIDEEDRMLQSRDGASRFDSELASDPVRRRALFGALLRIMQEANDSVTLLFARHELVSPADALWILEQLRTADVATKSIWSYLLWHLFVRSGQAVPLLELIYAAILEGETVLRERFESVLEPIELGSPRALTLRAHADEMAKWERRDRRERPKYPATPEQVIKLLDQFDSGDMNTWWQLCTYISRNSEGTQQEEHYLDPAERPVWSLLDDVTRSRAVDAAHRYVLARSAEPDEWLGKEIQHRPAVSGYRALVLLQREAPERLSSLSNDVWRRWAPILIAQTVYGTRAETVRYRTLIARAYAAAPDVVLATLGVVIDQDDVKSKALFALDRMDLCWDDRLGGFLLDKVRNGGLSARVTELLLHELVERGVNGAESYTASMVHFPVPTGEAERSLQMLASRVLLSTGSRAGRHVVWPAMQRDAVFGRDLLLSLAQHHDWLIPKIEESWGESGMGDLYLWLEVQFPLAQDPRPQGVFSPTPRYNIGDWRRRLHSTLEHLGTRAAVGALERIYDVLPFPWHADALRNARELTRRNTWTPPSAAQVLQMARNQEARLVRDSSELMRVVRESLGRFQEEVQGENPLSRTLWHPIRAGVWRPRDEGDLADAIERHLRSDLEARGIVAGREIVIRRGSGEGAGGHRTDLYVYAVTPGKAEDDFDTAFLIIEVKGSWHEKVLTAMKSQLLDDYLAQNQRCQHGLYVVGWYASPRWDPHDRRRGRSAKFRDPALLAATLHQQARELTASSGRKISCFVLDLSLGKEEARRGSRRKGTEKATAQSRSRARKARPARRSG